MAIICEICGKKQRSFIADFPLSDSLPSKRICAVCKEQIDELCGNCDIDPVKYEGNKNYLIECLKRPGISDEVTFYVNDLINECSLKIGERQRQQKEREEAQIRDEEKNRKRAETIRKAQAISDRFTTTTGFNFEGFRIVKYHKTICAESVLGTGMLSELSAGISDFLGTESNLFADKLQSARDSAFEKLVIKAVELDANALIGLNYSYNTFTGNMVAVIVIATAVTIEKL